MILKFRSIILMLVASAYGDEVHKSCDEKVGDAFRAHQVVPDVIPNAPKECAYVKFPTEVEADLGNELTPVSVRDTPAVFWRASPDYCYVLALVDPDVPSRAQPADGPLVHWLVGNIPGDYLHSKERTDILAEFVSSSPGPFSGLHRYVFLVYQQPKKLAFDEPRLNDTSLAGRTKFSIKEFASKYKLGDPIAGNFYQAKYDAFVPFARAQLGDYSLIPCLTGPTECK